MTVTLRDVKPTVWRTILARPDTKLSMLHRYVQGAMGWQDYHHYSFTIGGREYGIPNREFDAKSRIYDARRYTLARLLANLPAVFRYVYDFGDHWEHDVTVKGIEPAAYREPYPVCVDGAEPCPPEDCGGPSGYDRLRAILSNERDAEHAEMRAWAAAQHYDRYFSTQTATWTMRGIQRGYR